MKIAVTASLAATSFTLALAADLPPQNIRQDVARLTLLPGPHLTSPAKGAPSLTLPPPTVGEVTFAPVTREAFRSSGPLQLSSSAPKPAEFAPPPKPQSPPNPDSLRFDEKLPATAQPLVAPKRN